METLVFAASYDTKFMHVPLIKQFLQFCERGEVENQKLQNRLFALTDPHCHNGAIECETQAGHAGDGFTDSSNCNFEDHYADN